MARRLVRIGVASTAFMPSVVMALGLGALESESALNQPLQARIPLQSASAQEIETLEVQLASQEAFERVGLDRPFSLSDLEFDVVTDGPDAPYIEVTTSDSVREPFLAFLIELDWSGGRLLREYTLLLDPPVRDGDQPDTTVAEGREPDAAEPEADDGDDAEGQTSGRSASAEPSGQRPDEIRVQDDDTLWDLAEEAREGDVSVHQMMMAMLEANPDAFRDDNVNNLQAGSVLRVPDEEQVRALTASEARERFASQMEAWRSGRSPEPEQPDEEAVAEEDGDGEGEGQDDGRLEIAAAGESGGEDATASLTDEDLEPNRENVERLQSELKTLRESEAQLESQNEELEQKTEDLLDRVRALENTIDLQVERGVPGVTGAGDDDETEATDDTASDSTDEAGNDDADSDDSDSADESADEDSGLVASQDDEDADTGADDEDSAQDDAEGSDDSAAGAAGDGSGSDGDAASESDEEDVAAADESGSTPATPFWQDYRVMGLGAAGLAALALLGLIFARRRRSEAVDASDTIDETATTAPFASTQTQTAAVDTAAEDQGADAVAAAMATEEPEAAPAAGGAGDQDVDPLEEIEIYLAYGRYDQAGDLLASAIASEPGRKDLRLKQLEIHGLTHDRAAFESDAQALYGLVDGPNDPVWQQAREMGREVAPENPLFSDGDTSTGPAPTQPEPAAAGPSTIADDDFSDLDFSLDDSDTDTAPSPAGSPATEDPAGTSPEPAATETESFDLDFDFEDTGADAGGETPAEPAESGADADETSRTDAKASDSLDMEFDLGDLGAPGSGEPTDASERATETGGGDTSGEDDAPSFSIDELDLGDAESDAEAEEQGLRYEGPEAFAGESEPDTGGTEETAAMEPEGETETAPADTGSEADEGAEDDDLFDAGDENSTKIDLARAYLDMGDSEGARSLLDEVIADGSDEQKAEARSLYEEAR